MKIILQVGHWDCEKLSSEGLRPWRDVDYLRRSTGASGERVYHYEQIAPILKAKLENEGFTVQIVDCKYSKETTAKADLWVSLHYDGGGSENRCMVTSPKRGEGYLEDDAHNEADRFCDIWREVYPTLTGTINRNERITSGMLEYYGFDYVNTNTPAVIIEHFNHTSDKGGELKNDAEKVAHADYMAIMKFFGKEGSQLETFTLETDIPTAIEEEYDLKEYAGYSKYWTFGDLLEDWVAKEELIAEFAAERQSMQSDIKTLKDKISFLEANTEPPSDILEPTIKEAVIILLDAISRKFKGGETNGKN